MDKALVLLYHGVTNSKNDKSSIRNYNCKHLPVNLFEKQIYTISKSCNIITINQFVENWINNIPNPKNTVVITFDDGFKNNLDIAVPILEKYSAPATFYVSTGNISTSNFFWVDNLELAFDKTKIKEINKERTKLIFEITYPLFNLNNKYLNNNNKILALDFIKKKLKLTSPIVRSKIIDSILNELEMDVNDLINFSHYDYSIMNWRDVKEIDKKSLFTVGGHSNFHNILSTLSNNDLFLEIESSINKLKNELDYFSGHYAYPEGQKEHFDKRTIDILKRFKVVACPSAIQGLVDRDNQSLFNFNRVMIGINKTSEKIFYEFVN